MEPLALGADSNPTPWLARSLGTSAQSLSRRRTASRVPLKRQLALMVPTPITRMRLDRSGAHAPPRSGASSLITPPSVRRGDAKTGGEMRRRGSSRVPASVSAKRPTIRGRAFLSLSLASSKLRLIG